MGKLNIPHLITCSLVNPEDKDYDRALGLCYSDDPECPQTTKAVKMAKSIKDPLKLVRRSKAVAAVWGTGTYLNNNRRMGSTPMNENVWNPFREALVDMGFNEDQISIISSFEIDEENL